MEKATKQTVKVGTLLMSTYGCTMHRASYWQVVSIQGSKVQLAHAKSDFEGTGYDCGYQILIGASDSPTPVKNAKFTASGLKLCDRRYKGDDESGKPIYDEWKAGNHYWDLLKHVEPGHREYTYGD